MTTRRLAAILAADVVGYSKLVGEDETRTLAALREIRKEIVRPVFAEHGGRVFKVMGDGLLAEFPSAVQALRAAISMQEHLHRRNEDMAAGPRIEVRTGIHQGDVVVEGADLLGDGVNIAARLEGLAEPGGICISGRVHEDAAGKIMLEAQDLGEQVLKNITRPVRAYRISIGSLVAGARHAARPTLALPEKPSIAVLPFQNMSGDPEQDYFADGMVEEIITALSRVRSFFVIARNSTFTYKGNSVDVRQVSRELGVQYVLEGSVRKAGTRLRVTCQLIDATTGNHTWAERYDRELADIFAVQDEIAQSVVSAIEPQLYAAENIRIQSTPPDSLDAWGCVIRALWHIGQFSKDDAQQATQLLKQAIAVSPGYAKAHSLLAFAELFAAVIGGSNIDLAISSARQNARAALALDDDDPWGHLSSGFIEIIANRYDHAIACCRQAIEINPNFALAYGLLAGAFAWNGQSDNALDAVDRAIRMSPRDPFKAIFLHHAAAAHFVAERYADGVACEEQALRDRPTAPYALRTQAACYVGLGQLDKARANISRVLVLQPNSSIKLDIYGYAAFARASDLERYVAALRRAGLPEE